MKFQKFQEYVNEATVTYTDKYADLTLSILQTMSQNKMLHWGTTSYAQHKTFCDFMEEFDELGDSLVESIMGKFGRPMTGGASIEVLDYNQLDVTAYFNSLYEYYTAAIDQFQPKEQNEEIVNILAEIIALIDRTKYLLTLNESELLEALNEDDRVSMQPEYKKLMELEEKARNSAYRAKDWMKWSESTGDNYRQKWEKMVLKLRGWNSYSLMQDRKSKPKWVQFCKETNKVEDYNFGDITS